MSRPIGYVGFLRRWSENGAHFSHFGLESGWVFEGTTEVYEHSYRLNSKWVRKSEICEFQIDLNNNFCVCALI